MKIQGPNRGPKEAKCVVQEKNESGGTEPATGWAWGAARAVVLRRTVVPLARTAVRACGCAAARVLPSLLDFQRFSCYFCFIRLMYLDL